MPPTLVIAPTPTRPRPHLPVLAGIVVDSTSAIAALVEVVAADPTQLAPLTNLIVKWGLGGDLNPSTVADLLRSAAEKVTLADDVAEGLMPALDTFEGSDRMPPSEAATVAADLFIQDAAWITRVLARPRTR